MEAKMTGSKIYKCPICGDELPLEEGEEVIKCYHKGVYYKEKK